jgi:hypothetical protein
MNFKDFDHFTREVSPEGSKAQFQSFLQRRTSEKKHYDSNRGHELTHHYKVMAYKEKELN